MMVGIASALQKQGFGVALKEMDQGGLVPKEYSPLEAQCKDKFSAAAQACSVAPGGLVSSVQQLQEKGPDIQQDSTVQAPVSAPSDPSALRI
jgi:hypothetical protein